MDPGIAIDMFDHLEVLLVAKSPVNPYKDPVVSCEMKESPVGKLVNFSVIVP